MVALFSSGRSAFMINGNWEVPTLVDLQKQGKLPFEYGIVPFPKLFDNPDTWGDSHQLAIPNNAKTPPSPGKGRRGPEIHRLFVKQPAWAGGGHIPSYLPLQESDVYKEMSPNNQYSAGAAEHVVLDPALPIFGVGSPSFGAVSNFLIPGRQRTIAGREGIGTVHGGAGKVCQEAAIGGLFAISDGETRSPTLGATRLCRAGGGGCRLPGLSSLRFCSFTLPFWSIRPFRLPI